MENKASTQTIKLFNESCFPFLKKQKSNSVSLILIDPPYEVSRETNFASSEETGTDTDRFRVSMDFGDWDYNFKHLDEVIKFLNKVEPLFAFMTFGKLLLLKDTTIPPSLSKLGLLNGLKLTQFRSIVKLTILLMQEKLLLLV